MDIGNDIFVIIVGAPFVIATLAGQWALFRKAGYFGWAALIPFYSFYVTLRISGRPAWWLIWTIIPLAGAVVQAGVTIDFAKSYGKFTFGDRAAVILVPFVYLPKWGFEHKTTYLGPSAGNEFKKTYPRSAKLSWPVEWAQAFGLAIITALFIRTFFIETYAIPTPSMERTLMVGDYVMVSKINYGARLPITPIAVPFTQNTIPKFLIKSYWDGLQLPYFRLPGFSSIKRGDVVVFNDPADTLRHDPPDRQEPYIKRCTGIAGDTVSMIDGEAYIDEKAMPPAANEQLEYNIEVKNVDMNPALGAELGITTYEGHNYPSMTKSTAAILRKYSNIKSVKLVLDPKGSSDSLNLVFPAEFPPDVKLTPQLPDYKWNVDNLGPIIIPKKGWTVKLDSLTFPLYERCIQMYEHNKVEVKGGDIFINGRQTDSYTFKMNYYWMVGDNLHDSYDSRFWGFVPEDRIIGKALLIYMSMDNNAPLYKKIRWDRIFKSVN